jgi:hypothetical protein
MKFLVVAFIIVLFASCGKEYSFENPLSGSPVITIGNNCIINRITEYDTLGNRGASAFNYTFNATGTLPLNVLRRDSITTSTIFSKTFTKNLDTVRVDGNQYFILDTLNNNRIKQFVGNEIPYFAASPVFIFNFTYNNAGKLITKTQRNPSFPTSIITQTDYAYNGNNLVEVTSKIPITNTTFFTATISYDLTKQPKNFLYFLPEANELQPYKAACNFGVTNTNAPLKIIRKNFNQITGVFIDSTLTEYTKYKYSSDGYVLSVDATGYDIPSVPLVRGRNTFGYFCR